MKGKGLCFLTVFLIVLSSLAQPISGYSAKVSFNLNRHFDLFVAPLEFGLHIVIDSSITDLPLHVDKGEHHTIQIKTDFISGNRFSVNEFELNIDPILSHFGTEYHLEDYAEYGLPILEAILAAAGVALPVAGLVEVARQILIHTDIVLCLDLTGDISVSGPATVDKNKLEFHASKVQEFTLSIDKTALHNQQVMVSNQFLLDPKFRFDLDKNKVPSLIYNALNALLHLPWETSLGSDYGDNILKATTTVFDTTPPMVTITEPQEQTNFFSRNIEVSWQGSDDYGIDHYEIRLDEGSWTDVGLETSLTFKNLSPGSHTVEVTAVDVAGNTKTDAVTFIIRSEAGPFPKLSDLLLKVPVVKDIVLGLDGLFPGYGGILFILILILLIGSALYFIKSWIEE